MQPRIYISPAGGGSFAPQGIDVPVEQLFYKFANKSNEKTQSQQNQQDMPKFPTIFLSHGAPTTILASFDCPAKQYWIKNFMKDVCKMAKTEELPKGIIVFSAHWEGESNAYPSITHTNAPGQIYDFYGFPAEMYKIQYKPKGSLELSQKIASLIEKSAYLKKVAEKDGETHGPRLDAKRGLDHGSWVPLKLIVPNGDIPVVQVSLLNSGHSSPDNMERHIELGKTVASLREEGYLIIGSGSETHNLREVSRNFGVRSSGGSAPWAVDFHDYLVDALQKKKTEEVVEKLKNYRKESKTGAFAHPSEEHFLPFAVVLGAAIPNSTNPSKVEGTVIHNTVEFQSLSMACFAFD